MYNWGRHWTFSEWPPHRVLAARKLLLYHTTLPDSQKDDFRNLAPCFGKVGCCSSEVKIPADCITGHKILGFCERALRCCFLIEIHDCWCSGFSVQNQVLHFHKDVTGQEKIKRKGS